MAAAPSPVLDRAEINRANSRHSTGPRTDAGKQRSSQNALRHGLTAQSVVIPSEEQAGYQQLCTKFFEEYKPATATEAALVQQLADTTWRLNRILQLEDAVLADDSLPPQAAIDPISRLGLYSSRLCRQFLNKAQRVRSEDSFNTALRFARSMNVKQLREIQDHHRQRDHQETQRDPSHDGFVFSRRQVGPVTTSEMGQNNVPQPTTHNPQPSFPPGRATT